MIRNLRYMYSCLHVLYAHVGWVLAYGVIRVTGFMWNVSYVEGS